MQIDPSTPITEASRRIWRELRDTPHSLRVDFDEHGNRLGATPDGMWLRETDGRHADTYLSLCGGRQRSLRAIQDLLDAQGTSDPDAYLHELDSVREWEKRY